MHGLEDFLSSFCLLPFSFFLSPKNWKLTTKIDTNRLLGYNVWRIMRKER